MGIQCNPVGKYKSLITKTKNLLNKREKAWENSKKKRIINKRH